ncbi:MAG TPA: DNA-3-methyladenine glycosylase [Leptospiraceae bacterium]|nr:DNA-3-methyladenine glycosylase [Leptospiraceae bacterium]
MHKTTLRKHLRFLAAEDQDVASALQLVGFPEPRPVRDEFETLVRIVIGQQISKEAAASIFLRFQSLVKYISPEIVSRFSIDELSSAGLSARKADYIRSLAQNAEAGTIDFPGMRRLADHQVISMIESQYGFGRWSAEIFLMFALNRKDVFAADDLALRQSLSRLKKRRQPFTASQARKAVEHWSPYRTAGSILLWHYYRGAPQ